LLTVGPCSRSAHLNVEPNAQEVTKVQSMMQMPADPALAGRWKWFVGFGVVLVILGLIALMNAVDATLITTIFVGWLLLLGGIAQIVAAFASPGTMGSRVLMGVLGVLYLVVGWDIIANPLQGVVTLTIVISIVLIVEGIIRLFRAFSGDTPHRGIEGVIGVIDILLGLWLWTNIPISGVAIGFFVGFELLMAGIIWIIGGWMSRSAMRTPAMAG
jgi:uncharacterized membrane protein HdeD (DUF308 family)